VRFYQDNWQVVGLLFSIEGEKHIVMAAAYDQFGYKKLENLRNTILIIFIASIILIYAAGRFFLKKHSRP